METRENYELSQNNKNNHLKNVELNELFKLLKKSVSFEYECLACGEKMSYKLSFDLIEETMKNKDEKSDKKPKQYILINAKPFANKNNYNNKESYIHGIKKSFTYSSYKEMFTYIDFKDSSYKYANLQEQSLIKVYNDLIKSVKENKSRIKINKYHLIFNYYIADFSNWNNSIMLTLDNENEYNILECYGNANLKAMYIYDKNQESTNQCEIRTEKNNRNRSHSKSPVRCESKTYNNNKINNEQTNNKNSFNNNNHTSNNSLSSSYQNNNNSDNINDKTRKSKITNKKSASQTKNNNTNKNNKEKEKEYENNINNYNITRNKSKTNTNSQKSTANKIKKKTLKKNQELTSNLEKENKKGNEPNKKTRADKKKEKKINDENKIPEENILKKIQSPTKAEKERITKNFLYGEYNFPNPQSFNEDSSKDKKNEEDKKNEDKEEEESDWGSSEFYDDDENSDKNENENKSIDKNKDKDKEKDKENLINQNKEKSSLQQKENTYNESNFTINDNRISNNLLGHKRNTNNIEEEQKKEKNNSKNIQKEKNNNNLTKINKKINEKKNNVINAQIITITESDEDSNINYNRNANATKIRKIGKTLKTKISNLPSSHNAQNYNNEDYGYYDQSSQSQSNKSNISVPINVVNSNNRLPQTAAIFNSSPNPKEIQQNNNNRFLLKYMSEPSNIIYNMAEIQLIKDKIEKCNDLYFNLVYNSLKDKDDYTTFKNAVVDNYRHIILIKTTKDRRFAIYFNEKLFSAKGIPNHEIIDMMGFIFSFDKYVFYMPRERMVCFTQSPPMPYLFKLSDYSIYIKNNFKSCKHHLGQINKIFNIQNLHNELNGGESEYDIALLEVYRAEIPNK